MFILEALDLLIVYLHSIVLALILQKVSREARLCAEGLLELELARDQAGGERDGLGRL